MGDRTKIDRAGHIAIPEELRRKYGLHPKYVADIVGTDDGLLVRKTAIPGDSDGAADSQQPSIPVPEPVKRWPDEGVEYRKETDSLILDDGLVIEQAAEKLRRVLYPMLVYLEELDQRVAANAPKPVLEDIVRISSAGQIKVGKEFRYRYGLHPNAEVEIADVGDGLLVCKVADSENPLDRAVGSAPPTGIADSVGRL